MEPPRHGGHQAVTLVPIPVEVDRVGTEVVDAMYQVHSRLGPGLRVEAEVPVPILYDGIKIDVGFKIDLLVEDCVIIEAKATLDDHPIFKAQLLTQLKLAGKRLGFLANFNKKLIKDGIQRIAL